MQIMPNCPYCDSPATIRYGRKCEKQRFFCKSCQKIFVPTTHTIMANSHFPKNIWCEVIKDTIRDAAIAYTAQRIDCSHQAVFNMRHKVFMALRQLPEVEKVCLGEVSEFDETFVLNCYKGKKLARFISRKPWKKEAFSTNTCASVQAFSTKEMLLLPQSIGQNLAPKSLSAYLNAILPTERLYFATDYAVTMLFRGL